MVFLVFSGRVPQEEVLKLMKDDLYWVLLRPFGTFSLSLWAGLRMAYISIAWNVRVLHVVACSIVFILLCYQDWQGGVLKL